MKLYERLPEATLTGRPEAVGNIVDADSILVQELGSNPDLVSNKDIVARLDGVLDQCNRFDANKANARLQDVPLFVSGSIAEAIKRRQREDAVLDIHKNLVAYRGHAVHIFIGESAVNGSENLGTFGELKQFRDYREPVGSSQEGHKYRKPVLVTSGYNAGNIQRQMELLDMPKAIVPEGLPRSFDMNSNQLWTKHWLLWVLTSHLRIRKLRAKGH